MKALRHLNKYLLKYKFSFFLGFVCVLASNFFGLFPAIYIGKGFDFVEKSLVNNSEPSGLIALRDVAGQDVLLRFFFLIWRV